jgi:hypothetical protein
MQAIITREFNPMKIQIKKYRIGTVTLLVSLILNTIYAGYLSSKPQHANLDALESTLSGRLSADTTISKSTSPWQITGDLIVPDNVTLTIEAGAVVYFNPGTGITIEAGGCLSAEGSENDRILLTHSPESTESWDGISFQHTLADNQLLNTDMEYGDHQNQVILVQSSKLLIDNLTWTSTNKTIIEVNHPYLLVRNSVFPPVEEVEPLHGENLSDDEYLIFDHNIFNPTTGYNDVIDFSYCQRPGPILQLYNNIFLGGDDDGLDLDGCDAHIEGNIFMNFHKNNTTNSTSNAIATGLFNDKPSEITVVRNIFYDNDHAVLLKEDCFMRAENNVIVNSTLAAVNFGEPERGVDPGRGATFDGNIFWQNTNLFANQTAQPGHDNLEISVNHSVVPESFFGLGIGNLDADPQFVDYQNHNYQLQSISPCIGTGPNGLDMGAAVPAGATITGEPDSITNQTTVTLTIAGPGITHYKYVVNDPMGNWGEELSLADHPTLILDQLSDGQSYTIYVKGKNSAGVWQVNPEYAISKTWTVSLSSGGRFNAESGLCNHLQLAQNHPNPFNATTRISYFLPRAARVSLEIFSANGAYITTLLDQRQNRGYQTLTWDAANLPSGIYFYRLQVNNPNSNSNYWEETGKCILQK